MPGYLICSKGTHLLYLTRDYRGESLTYRGACFDAYNKVTDRRVSGSEGCVWDLDRLWPDLQGPVIAALQGLYLSEAVPCE